MLTGKRAEPRVAFVSLIETGLIAPGAMLYDAKKRWAAKVRADGTLAIGDQRRLDPPDRRRGAGRWTPATAGPSGTTSAAAA